MEQTIQEQARLKMLAELTADHNSTLDFIHNVLCDFLDDEISTSILLEGKTIHSALNFAMDALSKDVMRNGSYGFTGGDNKDLFALLKQYYLSNQTTVGQSSSYKVSTQPNNTQSVQIDLEKIKRDARREAEKKLKFEQAEKARKKIDVEKKKADEQGLTSIFDFIDDPTVGTACDDLSSDEIEPGEEEDEDDEVDEAYD